MKNWNTLEADLNLLMNKHFTKGRQGRSINKIILHHNDGNLSIQGCWNVWQTRPASAHYQVETSGRIGQLVWDRDTAWHAGNWVANTTSIGIEHADAYTHPTAFPMPAQKMGRTWSPRCVTTTSQADQSGVKTYSDTATFLQPNAPHPQPDPNTPLTWPEPATGTTR